MSTCKINPVVAESTNTAFSIFVQRELDKFDNAVDYTFNVRKEKGVPKEIVTLKVKLADNTEVDLSEAATNEYAKILGSTGNKVVLRSNIRPLYGSATRSGQTVVLDGNSLMKEFTNYIFNHIEFSSGQAAYKSKRFNNLTEFLAESNDSHIETILNKFYAESSQRGVLQQIEDELKGDPTEQEKQLNRVKQELKNRLAGYKISLTELEEEYEITEDDKGNQDWTDSNRQEPTSFADSLLRLYLSSVLDDRGNPYEARNLQNRLLKSYAHLSAQEVEDDLRKAYENPTNLNSFKVQIYRDLFLPETSITPNGKSKLSRIELRHQQIREQAKLSLLTFISKAVAEPINIVKLADGAVIANDSVLETEYNVAIKTVQEILKTFSTGETTAGLTMFKFSGNQFELQEKALNFTKPLNTNNDIGQFLYETGLFNTVFGRVKEDAEEKFGQFMTFLEAFPVEKAKFTGYVNELQKALLNAVAFTNKTDGKIIANDLFTPYGSHYLPNTGNIPVYKNLQTAYKELIGFLHTYYEEYPRNNRYMKEGKSVYQVSLSNTANNNVQDLKREFADPASRVDPSLFLGKILTHVDFTKLGIKEIVQIEDQSIGREAAFGFMEPDEFVQSIIIGLANLNAVSSLRAADRGLQRAFTGLVSAEIDRQKALDILRDMLRSEIATALYFRTNESVFNLLEGTQYQLSAKNLRIFKELQDDGSQDTDTNVNLEALAETLQTTLNKLKLETYDELKDTIFAFIDDYFKTANFDSYFDKLIEAQTEQFANSLANSMGISGNVAVDSVAAKLSKAFADKIVNSGNIINSRDIAKKLALMFVPGTLMQQYISFGDIGNFKPDAVKKRVDGNFSTRENSPQMGQTHFDTMNRLFPRMDGKSHSNEITDLVIAEPKKALDGSILPFYEESLRREAKVIYPNNESLQESYVESRLAEAKKDGFIDIIDATTYTSLDYFEQSMLNNSSLSYSEQHKAAVQYEKQLLAYSFLRLGLTYGQFGQSNQGQNNLNDPLMTIEKFNRLFGPQLSRPLTQEDVDENKFSPQYNGITIKPENFAIGLSIKKDQGYTQVTAIFNPETNTHEREAFKHLGLMELFKTAPNVIIPSNTKGAFANTAAEALRDPMYKLAAFMFAQQIDTIAPPSGRKFMKGSMNKDTGFVMSGNKVDFAIGDKIKHRQLSTRNLGKQLETGDFEKGSVTLSTQFRRLIGLDLTSFVDEDGKQMLYASFNRVSKYLNNASEKRFVHELQKLGYDVKYVNGKVQYSLDINDQETLINFIDKLSEQYQTRSVKVAVLEEFEALKNAVRQGLVSFDFSLQRSTL
jgi:hypothetical protein